MHLRDTPIALCFGETFLDIQTLLFYCYFLPTDPSVSFEGPFSVEGFLIIKRFAFIGQNVKEAADLEMTQSVYICVF